MNSGATINTDALGPLFNPWVEPNAHRVRAEKEGEPAKVVRQRRPSPVVVAQHIRAEVRQWREAFYVGASDTSRYLLNHWFERSHQISGQDGENIEFRYYFCQREAIETLIYLKEVRRLETLSQVIEQFGGADAEIQALGIKEDEDAWSRYAFKLATGSGKTKVMSLAVVWSYFHALRESDSNMARHFVVIAPNLTVFERLKEDFQHGKIFDADPLIPSEWRGDWNMSVVLQDEASGAATGGTLYLTNIHRLYAPTTRRKREAETYDWMGPAVSKAKALDTGAELRERITGHERVMILNDEAHHVWDPNSAWNEAIETLHGTVRSKGGVGIISQLDFTATPKDNHGRIFKHVVCDTPLGEAVDAGIVKTPIIGRTDKLVERADDNAAFKYEQHLLIGYDRWKASCEEWSKSGKKALLFVMCDDTEAADQITRRFNTDETFRELNGKTINLHTNLKGKVKKIGSGANVRYEFVENEKQISDDDLKTLRELSRRLDDNSSQYRCIVSVLMLREGWDVRNVTTIVPLRPYSSKANILPEQTLGRGLRRMTPPGQANELVTVVEHPSFASLYQQELSQEGVPIEIVDINRVPPTTVSIFPDEANKDLQALDVQIPRLSAAHEIVPKLEDLSVEDVRKAFSPYRKLPLAEERREEIKYEGRNLFTNEIVEKMVIQLPLLESGVGAVSFYRQELETACKVKNTHTVLAPLIQVFLEEMLFEEKSSLYDQRLVDRLSDSDVREHLRAVFTPLIRSRTTSTKRRVKQTAPLSVCGWKPYQASHSEKHPVLPAVLTPFNLVPCDRNFEVAFSRFIDKAPDVAAFAKNAGPQCLRIDYLADGMRLAFYRPDFMVRAKNGNYYLVETKGREDKDVPAKAKAANIWCKSASTRECKWSYLYVPQGTFEKFSGNSFDQLARTCEPALQHLIKEETKQAALPLFASEEKQPETSAFIEEARLKALPSRYRQAVEQAISLYQFMENKEGMNYAPVFTALLGCMDEAAKGLLLSRLQPCLPVSVDDQKVWFTPYLGAAERRKENQYAKLAQNLKRTLIFQNGLSPIGLLRSCLDYALNDHTRLGGVFEAVKTEFKVQGGRDLLSQVKKVNDFRNTCIAHQEKSLVDSRVASENLKGWIAGLELLHGMVIS
jgi:type III restriction enzyme